MSWTRAGQFNRRIRLEKPLDSDLGERGSTGELLATYVPYADCWAHFRTLSGEERTVAQQASATRTHEVTIRYRKGVSPSHRIVMGLRTFDVKDVRDVDEAHIEIRMMCVEVV